MLCINVKCTMYVSDKVDNEGELTWFLLDLASLWSFKWRLLQCTVLTINKLKMLKTSF